MSSTEGRMVYEIRDGSEVLGQFSVKAKALSFKKECFAEGRKVKVVTRFVKDAEKKTEPKAVPKKTVKTVPRTVRKDVPKPVRKEIPEPQVPKRTVMAPPRPNPKPVPASNEAFVSGRTLKALSKLFTPLEIYDVPLYSSSFYVFDPAHVAMIGVSTSDGRSLFGLNGDGPADVGVGIYGLTARCSASSVYRVYDDGRDICLDDGTSRIIVGSIPDITFPKRPKISMSTGYTVDPATFDLELRRVKGLLNGGCTNAKNEQGIRLYGKDGDLMMTGRNGEGYGFLVDVGDGDKGNGSWYPYRYLKVLADMFLLSDSPCTLVMDEDFPLEGSCSMNGLQLTMMIAPQREE